MRFSVSGAAMKDDLVDLIAEGIWQAEWARAGNGGRRRIPWTEVAEVDRDRYRFVADAILAIARPAILEEAAQVADHAGTGRVHDDTEPGVLSQLGSQSDLIQSQAAVIAERYERIRELENLCMNLEAEALGYAHDKAEAEARLEKALRAGSNHHGKWCDAMRQVRAALQQEGEAAEAIAKLKSAQESSDTERAHSDADDAICELLINLGYQGVVDEYHKVDKWYT